MEKLNKKIINFIEKYPFFIDPIVLFKTNDKLSKKDFLNGKIKVNYPEIKKISKYINKILIELKNIKNTLEKTDFSDLNYKNEYKNRLNDFSNIIKIIEIFYDTNEEEKFKLVNKYFGVNIDKIGEILENKNHLLNYFSSNKAILDSKKISKYKKTILNSLEIKKYFTESLKYLNLEKNWKVKIGDPTSIIHTNFNKLGGEIIIPKNKRVNIKKLLELIIHEIDGHCVQFSNAKGLYSGSIRFSKSEVLLEGYAMFLEYSLTSKYFGENRISELINKKELHYNYIKNKLSLNELLENYKGNTFRLFRGFKNIKEYSNLKDMVYLQGIHQVILNLEKYGNFLDLINIGVVNQDYIEKNGIKTTENKHFKLKNTSAIYILNKYFK